MLSEYSTDLTGGAKNPFTGRELGTKSATGIKMFFFTIIICTIAFLALQIQNNTYDKKYTVSLLVIFIFAIIGALVKNLKGAGPYGIFYALKFLFMGGPLLTLFVLLILMGEKKF